MGVFDPSCAVAKEPAFKMSVDCRLPP